MECMDASQDNGFGSFASGGVGSGVPISSGVSMDGNDIVLAGNNSASGDSKKKRIALVFIKNSTSLFLGQEKDESCVFTKLSSN